MSTLRNKYTAFFSNQRTNNDQGFDEENHEIMNDDSEHLVIESLTEDQCIELWQVKSWRDYLNRVSSHTPIVFLTIKYIGFLVMFTLGTYVLWQCTEYFEEAKLQQMHIQNELNNFHNSAEQKLKQLNNLQEVMKDKLENINLLTEAGAKRIKDMFSFSKSDLLREYNDEDNLNQCEFIPLSLRFDCHPEFGASELSCEQRGCCWNALHQLNYEKLVPLDVPYCYYPKNWTLYKYENFTKDGNDFSGFLHLQKKSFYKEDLPLIKIETASIDDTTLRVKIFDPVKVRYEPPIPVREDHQPFIKKTLNPQYELKIDENFPGFKVKRTSDKKTLFDSIGYGGFIFADQFLQISSVLPSHNIYGLGEHRTSLKLNTNWQKLTIFNADQPPTENANLYGSHPFYMVVEKTGKAHGVLFLNSNAMDVILQPTPGITFRSIGGIFDIYFFLGPTPAEVLKQYSQIVGKPFMPPYWSLGFHLCKFGYKTIDETKAVWQRTREALIPFDTQWNDLDYMDNRNDFTYDKTKFKDLPNFIKELHEQGMHYVPIIDAGISASEVNGSYLPYDEGVKRNVLVLDSNGEPFKGKVWNKGSTSWPDFTNPETISYYTDMMSDMHKEFEYDGAWIDMNEPSNFYNGHVNGCEPNKWDNPPYSPNINEGYKLAKKTLCMNAKQHLGYHYNLHNIYGTSQAVVVNHALKSIRNKIPFIISRSTWEGHGHYAGHWTGDVYSSWHDLKMSIPEILAYSLFQIPMVGADICGFDGNATEALCNRWMQLGAFYPFSRNHNSDDTIDQDPVAMGQLVVMSSRKALNVRYYLLPYLYTLFYRAHVYGETVARPLFIEYNDDPLTYAVDTQFMWGSCLMIIPVLEENKTDISAYIPRGVWYNYYTMDDTYSIGRNYILDAPIDTVPLLVRGGCILPAQESTVTTTASRLNPFELMVAMDRKETAKGELFWDDGDTLNTVEKKQYNLIEFEVSNNVLTSSIIESSYNGTMKLGKIIIMGISSMIVKQVFINTKEVEFEFDKDNLVLQVNNLSLDMTEKFTLEWKEIKIETLPTTSFPPPQSNHYVNTNIPKQEVGESKSSAVNSSRDAILMVCILSLLIKKYVTLI